MSTPYPLRIDERIMPIIELKAKDEYIDKSTAIRKMIYRGVEDYVIELYKDGRISIGKAAEIIGKSVYDLQRLIEKKGVKIMHSENVLKKSKETAKKLFAK